LSVPASGAPQLTTIIVGSMGDRVCPPRANLKTLIDGSKFHAREKLRAKNPRRSCARYNPLHETSLPASSDEPAVNPGYPTLLMTSQT